MRPDPEDVVIALLAEAAGTPPPGVVGIGDDAATLPALPGVPVVTVDTMVEGRHWDDRLDPADVGWKLVATNVSDVAAMGGRAAWALLALTLPRPLDLDWVRAFAVGLGEGLRAYGVALLGGDTTGGPARVASLTVGGSAPRPILRSGARPGDLLWVTGELGRSGEALLSPSPSPAALAHLRRPRPPVALGAALGEASAGPTPLVTAMMDLSDGLARDLPRLCAASGVGATVDAAALPGDTAVDWKLAFGEDYELLFTTAPGARDGVHSLAMATGTRVQVIGEVTTGGSPRLLGGAPWPSPLDTHFPGPA